MPTKETIKKLIMEAFQNLKSNDGELIYPPEEYIRKIKNRAEERRLYEICINHRLAFYIENLLPSFELANYKVDIEYNLNNYDQKELLIFGTPQYVRPDILIHSRMDKNIKPQHLLIVEAKKDKKNKRDIEKINQFMTNTNFAYKFGLFVKYNCFCPIKAILFYKDNGKIENEEFEV